MLSCGYMQHNFKPIVLFSITQSTNCYIPLVRLILWRKVLHMTTAILFCFNLHSKRHKPWHSANVNHHYQTCYIIKTKKMLACHVLDELVTFTHNCKHFLLHLEKVTDLIQHWNTTHLPFPQRGVHPHPQIFWHPQHHPSLEVLKFLHIPWIGSMLIWVIGGYCSSLNYLLCVLRNNIRIEYLAAFHLPP